MASSVGSYRAGSGTGLMLVRADEQPASPDYGTGTCALVPVPNLLGIGRTAARQWHRRSEVIEQHSTF